MIQFFARSANVIYDARRQFEMAQGGRRVFGGFSEVSLYRDVGGKILFGQACYFAFHALERDMLVTLPEEDLFFVRISFDFHYRIAALGHCYICTITGLWPPDAYWTDAPELLEAMPHLTYDFRPVCSIEPDFVIGEGSIAPVSP